MNAKFEQLEATLNTKLDLILKTQGGGAMSRPSKQVQAISTTCFYCGSPSHESLDCEYYLASMAQEVANEQLYQVDEYNPNYHPSKLNNHPSYSYGKKHVENHSLVNTQNKQGGGYQGGNNTYQGRPQGHQGPNTFQRGAPNPTYSQEAGTSQAPQRQSYYYTPPGFENKGESHQGQDSREPSMKELLTALTTNQIKADQR